VLQGFRLRLSAAERGLSNYKKSGYAATTLFRLPPPNRQGRCHGS
jgi:hypothetical protein